jgi:hypothetical protein
MNQDKLKDAHGHMKSAAESAATAMRYLEAAHKALQDAGADAQLIEKSSSMWKRMWTLQGEASWVEVHLHDQAYPDSAGAINQREAAAKLDKLLENEQK